MAASTYQLVMRSGPTPGKVFPLEKNEVFIGRDLNNDLVISDAEISRKHARIVMQAGGFVIEDLGSTNGTAVEGQRLIGPYLLRPGEVITLGEHVTLAFEAAAFDPDATVASVPTQAPVYPPQETPALKPTGPLAPPPTPAPVYTPPPEAYSVPSFTGQVPPGPEEAVQPKKSSNRLALILVIAVLLMAICVCAGVLYYIDANYLWCKVFPFLPGCS